jgi:phage-related protein
MLGAQLDDLDALAGQLDRTGGALAECQSRSTADTNQVVESVRTAATTALQRITTQMDLLRESVRTAGSSSSAAQWTGANAERFRSAYHDFDASMQQAEATTKETFADFQRAIDQMAASLSDYVQQLANALTNAQHSTQTMSSAVHAQRANLESVMNTGLSVA